jgi:hypothetical protein
MPLFLQGTNDACRPCKTARRYIGGDESKSVKNIDSEKVLKLIDQAKGQDNHFKVGLKLSDDDATDDDDDDDNADLGNSKPVQLLGGTQVGTPLPNVELVKNLLQTGTALNSDVNSQVPLMANGQSLLPQSPTLMQPLEPQQLVQQGLAQQQQQQLQQQQQQQQQQDLTKLLPQVSSLTTPLNGNQGISSPLLKSASKNLRLFNEDNSVDSPLTAVQPVVLKPSLLRQALLGAVKFQSQHDGNSEKGEGVGLDNGLQSSSLPLGALSTLPIQDSVSTNQLSSLQGGEGVTSPLSSPFPAASLPASDVDVSKAAQFQSPVRLPDLQLPMQLGPPARQNNWFGFPPASVANKKSPFPKYKYDLRDKQGN